MANWTDLSTAFAYGTKLTSQQQQQLRDNVIAGLEGATNAPLTESAGANDYFTNGPLAGEAQVINAAAYYTEFEIIFVRGGVIRFDWDYRQDWDNETGYFRVLKNGVVHLGPFSDQGTSAMPDAWHNRVDDITVEKGDKLEWQGYVTNNAAAAIRITMKGTDLTASFSFYAKGTTGVYIEYI
jgi:hypothetical protein